MADSRSEAEKEQGEPGIAYVQKEGSAQVGSWQKSRRVSLKEAPTGPIWDSCTHCVIDSNIE